MPKKRRKRWTRRLTPEEVAEYSKLIPDSLRETVSKADKHRERDERHLAAKEQVINRLKRKRTAKAKRREAIRELNRKSTSMRTWSGGGGAGTGKRR